MGLTQVARRAGIQQASNATASCSGWSTGIGRKRKPLMMLKMEVLTAMPRARVTTASAANQGDLRSARNA
jgi:hypothetical protein